MKVKQRYFLRRDSRESEVSLTQYLYAQSTALDQPVSAAVAFDASGVKGWIKTEIEE